MGRLVRDDEGRAGTRRLLPSAARPLSGASYSHPFAAVLSAQRTAGNRAVTSALQGGSTVSAPFLMSPRVRIQRDFEDEGRQGQGEARIPAGQSEGTPLAEDAETATPTPAGRNEWGEIDGSMQSDVVPHIFVDGGKTGVGLVNWAGGDGGAGNQGVGSITLVAPTYETGPPSTTGGLARAWIRPATGTATVTRSFKGVQQGANATYYFTARACARADVHEKKHVDSSRSIHNTNISPLQTRVGTHRGESHARASGATAADAQTALAAFVDWNTAITAFSTQDTTANTPSGTVDTADLAAADFIRDYGPRAVGGANFAHYIDTPPGP
ncbi:MAG: hypothetical protein NVSMB32_03660 [Actinomycetota bacterium]